MKRTFTNMDSDIFLRLYKTMVRPHLEYANVIWSPHLKRLSQDLERVQRRATRLVPECADLPYDQRLRLLNLYSLKYRRYRGDLIQTFKIINQMDDVDPNFFYVFNGGITRHADHKIFIKRCNLNFKKFSFSHRTARAWNGLAIGTRKAENLVSFKRLLDLDQRKEIGIFDFD